MKKYIFYFFAFVFIVSACNQQHETSPKNNFVEEISQLRTIYKQSLILGTSDFSKNISLNSNNDLILNENGVVYNVLIELEKTYLPVSNGFVSQVSNNYSSKTLTKNSVVQQSQSIASIDLKQHFNESQIQLVKPYLNALSETDDFITAKNLTLSFQNNVIQSNFEREDKIHLLSLSASIQAMIEFFEEGGDDSIYRALNQIYDSKTSPRARIKGCEVNVRGVLAGGVVGFFSGGATGAYVGCAGGTVTLPGIGTVVGCVGGAVFGAAGGFVGGVLSGVASELIQTCLR